MYKFIFSLVSVISFVQSKGVILTQKESHMYTFNYASFIKEHNVNHLATFNDFVLYKTTIKNYNKYKNTFNHLFDVEEEQVYKVPDVVPVNVSECDKCKMQKVFVGGVNGVFEEKSQEVPWHLDRISKRHLPLDGTYPYSDPGSCHKNSEVDIETVVVDTGCDVNHPEFEGRAEFLANFADDGIDRDCNSHGTFCSSQIGGLRAGVCKSAKLFAVKVLSCDGSGSTSGVIAGMDYTFNRHIERERSNPKLRTIMSMSLGGGFSLALNRVVEKMVKSSDTFYIVVASGNENQDAKYTSPASARGIFTVNAMNRNDQRAYFSNYGKFTDIYSPGVENYGAILDGKYNIASGTSFSTPILAGIMNHVLDENPHMNLKQLKEKILNDATKDTIEGNVKNTPNLMVYLKRNDDN